jgi:hypothetical protein
MLYKSYILNSMRNSIIPTVTEEKYNFITYPLIFSSMSKQVRKCYKSYILYIYIVYNILIYNILRE